MIIRARIGVNEWNNTVIRRNFELVESLPIVNEQFHDYKVLKLNEMKLDCEERTENLYNYDYFKIDLLDEDNEDFSIYICIKNDNEEEMARAFEIDMINSNFSNICSYMDDEIREQLHSESCHVTMDNITFLKQLLCELDAEFTQLLDEEFSIEMEVLN